MAKQSSIIIVSYQSYKDPLFHGLILQYLLDFGTNSGRSFHVITNEQQAYNVNAAEKAKIKAMLREHNIYWYPQPYRTGGPFMIVKKAITLLQTILTCFWIRIRYRPKAIMGFLVLAGILAAVNAKLLGMKLIVFCFEPHSDYLVDFGQWKKSDVQYKLTSWLERWQVRSAQYITAPTDHTIDLVKSLGTKAEIFRLPISVDTDKFQFSAAASERIRSPWNIGDRPTVLYLGKFGGIYYSLEETAKFFHHLSKELPEVFFYVVTTQDPVETKQAFDEAGVPEVNYVVSGRISYDEIEDHISACDFGLLAVPPLESQKYRTPIKTGNYLSCGIPVIHPQGVSDDDVRLKASNTGIIISDFDADSAKVTADGIRAFQKENAESLRKRCREYALEHRALIRSRQTIESILNELDKR